METWRAGSLVWFTVRGQAPNLHTANLRALYKLADGNRQHSDQQQAASQNNFVPVLWNCPNAAPMLGGAEADDDLSLPKGMLLARFLIHCTQKLTCASISYRSKVNL